MRCKAGQISVLRRLVVQGLVGPHCVVIIDILPDGLTQLLWGTEFVDIDQLGLQRAEPALNHDVTGPTGFAVQRSPLHRLFLRLFPFVVHR